MTNRCGAHRSNRLLVYGVFDFHLWSLSEIRFAEPCCTPRRLWLDRWSSHMTLALFREKYSSHMEIEQIVARLKLAAALN